MFSGKHSVCENIQNVKREEGSIMPKKAKTIFVCQECGYESLKWMGQCICGAWNSMAEEKISVDNGNDSRSINFGKTENPEKVKPLSKIIVSDQGNRLDTGIGELNRVLGGGIVPGSLTLVSGEPGIGKSTLILQMALNIAKKDGKVLYISGEESGEQIKLRGDRICSEISENLYVLSETDMDNIAIAIENIKPVFLIIDSIQTMYTSSLESAPGSVSQVRGCGNILMRIGKGSGIPVFIIAHVTKSGDLAGPKLLEHMVDCVLHFSGERNREFRVLRSYKNRFGTTSEIGAFEMCQSGLNEINDLSKRFLEEMDDSGEGSMVTAVYEGTRPMLLEVQALTASANVGFARRTAIGIENGRLNMLIAVLEKKASLSLADKDIYVNIVGGFKPEGTSCDLAVALAIHSAYTQKAISKKTLALGEIGLTGDLRQVPNAEKIIKEAVRMGFEKIILPKGQAVKPAKNNIKILGVKNLKEAISCYGQE